MTNLYCFLLDFYPVEFQLQFRDEMMSAFERATAERHSAGRVAFLVFIVRELISLAAGAIRERMSQSSRRLALDDLPVPGDRSLLERQIRLVSCLLIHSIAHHDFARARAYDLYERKLRARLSA